jgi:hypothetical protein
METNCRADPAQRVLQGSSYAGLFTLYALFADPGLFSGYMAASPAVPFGDRYVFKQEAEYVEPGNPICHDLAGHKTRCDAAPHIPAPENSDRAHPRHT